MTIAAMLAEDVVHGLPDEVAPDSRRACGTARLALLGAALRHTWLAIAAPADPLQLFLWSLTLQRRGAPFRCCSCRSGGSAPTPGAQWRACCTGLGVTAFVMLLSETGAIGLPSALAGAVGLPLAVRRRHRRQHADAGAGRNAPRHRCASVRVPGGETLYDRELRLQRLRTARPS